MLNGYLNEVLGFQLKSAGQGQVAFRHILGEQNLVGVSAFIQDNGLLFAADLLLKVFQEPIALAAKLDLGNIAHRHLQHLNQLVNFWIESIAGLAEWSMWYLLPSVVSALLWPWVFLILRYLRRVFNVT